MNKNITKIIAYYRLSKKKRGRTKAETVTDAYGIDAQKSAVEYLRLEHGAKIVAEYHEIETGTNKRTRPQLAKALSHARLSKATLVIGKLDRLARNVLFTAKLLESQVDFICCDNPGANIMTIQIMAVMAEQEARQIASRTKDSLAAAKKKGVLLGSARPGHWDGIEDKRGWKQANSASAVSRHQRALDAYTFLIGPIREMRSNGTSLRDIAIWLNESEHTTTRGKPFTATAVMRLIELFKGKVVAA